MKYDDGNEVFDDLDELIMAADIQIPEIDLTASIMNEVNNLAEKPVQTKLINKRRKTLSLFQDIVTAAAAAIIIFWYSGPVLTNYNAPAYAEDIVKVSSSIGSVFESYINLYGSATSKISQSISKLGKSQSKGD